MTAQVPAPSPLRVVVSGRHVPAAARGLGAWLAAAAPRAARGTVDVALVGDRRMRQLNKTFRQVDGPTDVLSFPAEAPVFGPATRRTRAPRAARGGPGPDGPRPLGDIAIALGVAARQAAREGHSLRTELRVLALHGLLHLLGYDHERDGGEMKRVEERLRRRAGLPTGLIGRAPRGARS